MTKPKSTLIDSLDQFTRGYIECALWSSSISDSDDSSMSTEYCFADIARPTLEKMIKDCERFQEENKENLEQYEAHAFDMTYAGHDFWLTRNRHGSGFWDRYLDVRGDDRNRFKKQGDALTQASHKYPEVSLYINRGKVWQE